MAKCTLVVGLPGSGKTFYAKSILGNRTCFFDDPREEDYNLLTNTLKEGMNCVVTDPYLCDPLLQRAAKKSLSEWGVEIEWIFFENDPKQCLLNAAKRKDKDVKVDIEYFSSIYHIPPNSKVLPVYKCSSSD